MSPLYFRILCQVSILLPGTAALAQTVPDLPEPGLIFYGQVFAGVGGTAPLTLSSAAWEVDGGALNFTVNGASTPPVRIVQANGQSFYIASIPFRTHQVGTTTFAGPSGASQWLELKPETGSYLLTPQANGAETFVKSIAGVAQSAGTTAVTTVGLNAAERGKMIRVDLYINTQQPSTYDAWADQNFGGHTAANQLSAADFDGDGLSNGNEWTAGTDPKDPTSGLRIVSLGREASGDFITWKSAVGKLYSIEASSDLGKLQPWTVVGTGIRAESEQTSASVTRPAGQALRFYRVKVSQ